MLFLLRRMPVKTLKHLPKFLPVDDDFKNTALINDDEHEKLRLAVLDVKKQFFVETATWGLSDWERVLDLSVKENATIEDRRIQILLKLQGANTVSETFMNNLINMFCLNKTGYIIQHNPEYWFELCISSDDDVKWKELLSAINTYKPAHLGFAVVIRIISQILTKHKASIIQYINAKQNFWNLGTAETTHWNGIYLLDNTIDFSGIKPDSLYKERQSHLAEITAKVDVAHKQDLLFNVVPTATVTSKYKHTISHSIVNNLNISFEQQEKIDNENDITIQLKSTQSRTGQKRNILNALLFWTVHIVTMARMMMYPCMKIFAQ